MNNMRLPNLTYLEPKTIDELIEIKKDLRGQCAILAGGTDLIPMLKRRNISTKYLVNIKRVRELTEISYEKERGLRIGAAVSLRNIIDHPVVSESYSILGQAARSVAFNQLRNMGTVGGNICLDSKCTFYNQSEFWWKSRPNCFKRGGNICYVVKGGKRCFGLSAADTVSALIALEAELIIAGPGKQRRTLVETFYTGDGRKPHRLDEDEVVTAVLIPPAVKGWKEGFLKKGYRGTIDFAIASLSLRLKRSTGAIEDIRIALNGVSTMPIRAKKTEAFLIGGKIDDKALDEAIRVLMEETYPLSLVGSSAFMRKRVIEVMVADLIESVKH
jgi:4-hydroxybenzoyl-CoA reductase subunit beta